MRFFTKIALFAVVVMGFASCQELPNYFVDDMTVARVGRKDLRVSDVEHVVPKSLSSADSLQFVDMYIDRWITKQLKVQEAELLFPSSADDIEAKVEEYRQSLLIRKIEQYYIDTEPDSEISDADIEAYYNAHKSDFRLDKTVVKGVVVAFGEKFRRKDKLLEAMKSTKPDARQYFRDICTKNNFALHEITEWTDFGEFLALLPTMRSRNYDSLLTKSDVQKMNADGIQYYFRITAVLNKGEVQPLEMTRETIARVLKTQRYGEIIRAHEEEILQTAIENGHARIYVKENKNE